MVKRGDPRVLRLVVVSLRYLAGGPSQGAFGKACRVDAGRGDPADTRHAVEAIARAWGREQEEFLRGALTRLLQRWDAVEERRRAPELWRRLRRYRPERRRQLIAEHADFQSWGLVELLCRESEAAAADDAGQAVELAELAVLAAGLVAGDERWRARIQGFAWFHLGNGPALSPARHRRQLTACSRLGRACSLRPDGRPRPGEAPGPGCSRWDRVYSRSRTTRG